MKLQEAIKIAERKSIQRKKVRSIIFVICGIIMLIQIILLIIPILSHFLNVKAHNLIEY